MTTKITNDNITSMDASKLTGSLPGGMAPETDLSSVKADILKLALHQAIDGNRVAYNLEDSFVDGFEDDSGIATETTVDRDTTGEYVASVYDSNAVTVPTSSDWVTTWDGGGEWPATTGGIDNTGGDSGISSGVVLSGDFTVQFTGVGGLSTYSSCFGVHDVANDGNRTTNQRLGMDGSGIASYYWGSEGSVFHRHRYGNQNDDSGAYIYNDGSVVKITRTSGVIKFYDDGVLTHTFSTTNTNNMRFFIASGGTPFNQDYDDISFTLASTSTNATGTLISDPQTASTSRTSASGVIIYEDAVGTSTLGTDLKIYFTANDGTDWTEASSYGTATTYSGTKKLVKLGSTNVTAGTQVAMKAVWANQSAATISGSKYAVTSGMLSHTGLSSFVASEIVDGIKTSSGQGRGFYVASGTTSGEMVVDLGSGNAQALGKISVWVAIATSAAVWTIAYSDNGSSWTDTTLTSFAPGASAHSQDFVGTWDHVGAHRYWKMYISSGNGGSQGWVGDEIEWYAYTSTGKEARLHGWAVNY